MKKFAKRVARLLGVLVGTIENRKFKSFKIEKGKLFSDELFEKVSDRYNNFYLSKESLNKVEEEAKKEEQVKEKVKKSKKSKKSKEKDFDKEKLNEKAKSKNMSNIEVAVSRYLNVTVDNFDEYDSLIKKMFENDLVSEVFMFIQNNDKLPLEYRINMLNEFMNKEINKKTGNTTNSDTNTTNNSNNNSMDQILVNYLKDVDIDNEENKAKITEIINLLNTLQNSKDEKALSDLINWFNECGSIKSIYKCDALIEELKVLNDSVNVKKEEKQRKEIIENIKKEIENIKEDIKNAKTVDDINNLLNKTNNLFVSSKKQKILIIKECNELLAMIKTKKQEISENLNKGVKKEQSEVVETNNLKNNLINTSESIRKIHSLLVLALNYLSIEELEKAEQIYNDHKYLYTQDQNLVIKSKLIKSRAKIELDTLNLEEMKEHPFIQNKVEQIEKESKNNLTGDSKLSNDVYKGFYNRIKVAIAFRSKTILKTEEELLNNVKKYLTNEQIEDLKRTFEEYKCNFGQNNIKNYSLLG